MVLNSISLVIKITRSIEHLDSCKKHGYYQYVLTHVKSTDIIYYNLKAGILLHQTKM